MLLAINAGNTHISFGLFDGATLSRHGRVPRADLALLPERIGEARVDRVIVGSVAPSLNDRIAALVATRYGVPALFAGTDVPYGMEIECDEPARVGADRVINAVAAYARTRSATIIVDAGTALTVDLVSAQGRFCGGAIAPGAATMLRALHAQTEQLPEVTPAKPPSPVGRNTTDAIRSGVYWGMIGMVRTLVAAFDEAAGCRPPVLLTGGGAAMLAEDLALEASYEPTLTLEGLAIIAQRS